MYRRAQLWIYYLLSLGVVSFSLTTSEERTTTEALRCPEKCICLSSKQVLCNTGGLREIPTEHLPEKVEELTLTKNDFPVIKTDAFSGLRSLRKLNLDRNNISAINRFAFRGLSKLRDISIQHTPLAYIGQFSFAGLQNVTVLLLANNKISYIESSSFTGTSYVKALLLSNNPLLRIHSHAFAGLTNVERLVLPSGIRIIESDAFNGLQHVGTFKLTFMDLSSLLPYTFRGLAYVHALLIQDSDLGLVQKNAFAGLRHVHSLNILNNKIDVIEQLVVPTESDINILRFKGNHVLEATRSSDVNLQVRTTVIDRNHFPCDCQVHDILESDFVNGSLAEFQDNNFCISPLEYNNKPMSSIDFDGIARCHDQIFKDNLGSGTLISTSSYLPMLVIAIVFSSFLTKTNLQ